MSKPAFVAAALIATLPFWTPANAQFAGDAQSLFPETPASDQYETGKDRLVIWEFGAEPGDEPTASAARSVEDICCDLNEAERAGQAICIGVDFTCH